MCGTVKVNAQVANSARKVVLALSDNNRTHSHTALVQAKITKRLLITIIHSSRLRSVSHLIPSSLHAFYCTLRAKRNTCNLRTSAHPFTNGGGGGGWRKCSPFQLMYWSLIRVNSMDKLFKINSIRSQSLDVHFTANGIPALSRICTEDQNCSNVCLCLCKCLKFHCNVMFIYNSYIFCKSGKHFSIHVLLW